MVKAAQNKQKYERAWLNAVIFNSQGPKDPDTETPWQISDFIKEEETETKPLTEEEQKAAIERECAKWKIWADNCRKGA